VCQTEAAHPALVRLVVGPVCLVAQQNRQPVELGTASGSTMKDFSNAAFSPEIIEAMTSALEASVSTLPEPISSHHVNLLAESILRTAKTGERNPLVLQRMALLELQLGPRV